jgi:hypothetical protein
MKFDESLTTTKTKASLLHSSVRLSGSRPQAVVFLAQESGQLQLGLSLEGATVRELTARALLEFGRSWSLRLEEEEWELYASKKSGKICSGYPSLEPGQRVELTGFKYFLLARRNEHSRRSSESSSSSSRIRTDFTLEVRREVKTKEESSSCLCFNY